MNEAQAALRLVAARPRDPPHRRRDLRADAQVRGGRRAPTATTSTCCRTRTSSEKAEWSRAEIRFLRSFGQRVPFDMDPGADDQIYTVDFRLVQREDRRPRQGERRLRAQDFVVDTGAENTVLTRPTAQRLGILPVTYTLSAGVGDVGLRGLQLARIDSLEIGHAQAAQHPVPHQESAAARHPDSRRPRACRRWRSASR